jgi:hypothetical protein
MSDSKDVDTDKGLRKGGVVGAGAGAATGGVAIVVIIAVASGPPGWLTLGVGALIVVGCAAVGAVAGALTGK